MNFTEAIVLAVEKVKAWIQSGGVKWDHVSDKPFVKVGGDTLTWDGNTEGLENLLGFGMPFYKVSDAVISASDVAEGFSLTLNDGSQANFAPGEAVGDIEGLGIALSDYIASFSEADAATMGFVAGTYFVSGDGLYVSSLTIPGYTGFAKEQIDPKVLPEALQFGKTTVQSDTLEWDGNTEGLATLDLNMGFLFYRVSDIVLNVDDFKNGCVFFFSNGEATELSQEEVQAIFNENGAFVITFVCSISEELANTVGAQAGTYFGKYDESAGGMHVASLTIHGYGGFTKTEIKTIEPEYMPGAVLLYVDAENYLCSDSAATQRITKAELANIANSRSTVRLVVEEDGIRLYFDLINFGFTDVYGQASYYNGAVMNDLYTAEYTA